MPRLCSSLALLALLLLACEVRGPGSLAPGSLCDPDGPMRCEGPGAICLRLDDGAGICTHACRIDDDCPAGLTCETESGGATARCVPGFRCAADTDCPAGHRCDAANGSCYIPVRRGFCSPCSADAQCPEGGACLSFATGEQFCARACSSQADCEAGATCREAPRGGSWCIPDSDTCEEGRPLCAACFGDSQCGDGNDLCVTNFLSGERFCSVSCNPDCVGPDCACPVSFRCADLSGEGKGPFQCVPAGGSCAEWCATDANCPPGRECDPQENRCVPATDGRACAPCADDDDCAVADSRCLLGEDGTAFCAPRCTAGCEPGYVCHDVAGTELCVPASGSCTAGTGRLGEPCGEKGAAGCISGLCLRAGAASTCSARCAADADCGSSGWQCCAVVDGPDGARSWDCGQEPGPAGGVCAPRGGLFGDSCETGRPPCRDGHCLDLGASRICTASCVEDEDCDAHSGAPGSFVCRAAEAVGRDGNSVETVRICFPAGGGQIGSDCTFGPAACASQICIRKESGNVCTNECVTRDDCPVGWSCASATTLDGRRLPLCLPPTVG